MSSEIRGSFVENFCNKHLSEQDLKLFNTDECRVRVRDIGKNFFGSFEETQTPEAKFKILWELRNQALENKEMSGKQQEICDANLKKLSSELFQTEHDAQAERIRFFERDVESIPCEHAEELKKHLIMDGKVGITPKGEIIPASQLGRNSEFLVIQYIPRDKESPIFLMLPADWNWQIKGPKDSSKHLHGRAPNRLISLERGTSHQLIYRYGQAGEDRIATINLRN